MDKGWRNNLALVERRERLARERTDRRMQNIKDEIDSRARMEELDRAIRSVADSHPY